MDLIVTQPNDKYLILEEKGTEKKVQFVFSSRSICTEAR